MCSACDIQDRKYIRFSGCSSELGPGRSESRVISRCDRLRYKNIKKLCSATTKIVEKSDTSQVKLRIPNKIITLMLDYTSYLTVKE